MMKSSRIYSGLQEKLMTSNLRSNITPSSVFSAFPLEYVLYSMDPVFN
jgi:hypothetical protein